MENKFLLHPDCDPNTLYFTSDPNLIREAKIYTANYYARKNAMESKINFIPSDDRVLVEPDAETETYGEMGLVIPEQSREMPQIGTIVAVGPGRVTETNDFIEQRYQVGDRVLLSKFSGSVIQFNDTVYRLCQQMEIMGVFPKVETSTDTEPVALADEDIIRNMRIKPIEVTADVE